MAPSSFYLGLLPFLYPHRTNFFRECTGISLSVHPCVRTSMCASVYRSCVQNISFCQSAGWGFNPLLHRYSFKRINNRLFWKTLWEKKLLVTSNFFFSHNVFYSIRQLYPHFSIFMTSCLYLLLN